MNSPKLSMYYSQRKCGSLPPSSWARAGPQSCWDTMGVWGTHSGPLPSAVPGLQQRQPCHTSLVLLLTAERIRWVISPTQVRQQEPRTGKRSNHKGQRLQCCEWSKIGKDSGTKPCSSAWEHESRAGWGGNGQNAAAETSQQKQPIYIPPGLQHWLRKALSNAAS